MLRRDHGDRSSGPIHADVAAGVAGWVVLGGVRAAAPCADSPADVGYSEEHTCSWPLPRRHCVEVRHASWSNYTHPWERSACVRPSSAVEAGDPRSASFRWRRVKRRIGSDTMCYLIATAPSACGNVAVERLLTTQLTSGSNPSYTALTSRDGLCTSVTTEAGVQSEGEVLVGRAGSDVAVVSRRRGSALGADESARTLLTAEASVLLPSSPGAERWPRLRSSALVLMRSTIERLLGDVH